MKGYSVGCGHFKKEASKALKQLLTQEMIETLH